MRRKDLCILALLTLAALLVHGYHPGSEDSETYLPGVEKILNPHLFPAGGEYFQLHARMTLFPRLIAASAFLAHGHLNWVLFSWHLASLFLFLFACWVLAGRLFASERARLGAVSLLAALLTLPIAGTALYIMDQYINPRNLSAFAVVFGIVRVLDKKYLQAALFLCFAALVHPFMSSFAIAYCLLLGWMSRSTVPSESPVLIGSGANAGATSYSLLAPLHVLDTPTGYHDAANSHTYQYLNRWHWYEAMGAWAPLLILWWFRGLAEKRRLHNLEVICRSLVLFGGFYLALGIAFTVPASFESISRLQPMRGFYVLYILFVLISGGLLAEYVLRNRPVLWLVLFVPLSAGMCFAQRTLFPASAHIEWPWAAPENPWVQSFLWIRDNTPADAVFAIDPFYMRIKGEDANGFRAIANRSQLPDAGKDAGVVEMFPEIADDWQKQVHAQTGISHFGLAQFQHLEEETGVNWAVLQQPAIAGLNCPYRNAAVAVCRLPVASSQDALPR